MSDRPTFEMVYRQHSAYVYRTLRRLGVASRHCEDALQDVFVVVLRRLPEYEPRDRIKGWLAAIANFVAAKYRLREYREPVMDDESPGAVPSSEQGSADRELVLRLLGELDPDRRIVFILRFLDELTIAEIARALGIPEGTVSTRLRLARRDFEAAVKRYRAKDQHLALVPLQLLEAERPIPALPEGVEERVWKRLNAVQGGGGSGSGQAPAPGSGASSGAARSGGKALAIGAPFAIGVLVGALWSPLRAQGYVPAAVVSVAAETAPQAPVVGSSVPPVPPTTAEPAPTAPAEKAPAAAAPSWPNPAAERALMNKAADALAAGTLDQALAALQQHARRFRGGQLSEEREAAWIAVLLRAGRSSEAQERFERFSRAYPKSARLVELRRALGGKSSP